MRRAILAPEFVEEMPVRIESGKLYVSMAYGTAMHLCCCGCGLEVVTPFSPTDWQLLYDGKSISLDPSIGNWSFPCRSHYWIKNNRVVWAEAWSDDRVERARARDKEAKAQRSAVASDLPRHKQVSSDHPAWWRRLIQRIRGRSE